MKMLLAAGCTVVTIVVAAFQSRGSGSQRQPVQPTPSGAEPFRVGGGIPPGFMILGETQSSPPGYTFAGLSVTATTDSWAIRTSMPTGRGLLAAAALNNKIYAIGGENGSYLDTVEEYDPVSDTWTAKASMSTPRSGLAAAVVSNRIYAISGTFCPRMPLRNTTRSPIHGPAKPRC